MTSIKDKTTSNGWSNVGLTVFSGPMFSEIEWLLIQGHALGKKLNMTDEEIERWLYD